MRYEQERVYQRMVDGELRQFTALTEIEINVQALVSRLGPRAFASKNKRSVIHGGIVKVSILKEKMVEKRK